MMRNAQSTMGVFILLSPIMVKWFNFSGHFEEQPGDPLRVTTASTVRVQSCWFADYATGVSAAVDQQAIQEGDVFAETH